MIFGKIVLLVAIVIFILWILGVFKKKSVGCCDTDPSLPSASVAPSVTAVKPSKVTVKKVVAKKKTTTKKVVKK